MTATQVLERVTAAGVTLTLGTGDAIVAAPRGVLSADLRAAIRDVKPELVRLLADPLARFTDADLYRRDEGEPVEFTAAAWGDGAFWLVQGPREALALEAVGVEPGRIFCCCTVLDMRLSGLTATQQAAEARRKLAAGRRPLCVLDGGLQ